MRSLIYGARFNLPRNASCHYIRGLTTSKASTGHDGPYSTRTYCIIWLHGGDVRIENNHELQMYH